MPEHGDGNDLNEEAEELKDSPPTTKLVYYVLSNKDESVDHGELRQDFMLPDRSFRLGLDDLEEVGILERRSGIQDGDGRRNYCSILDE